MVYGGPPGNQAENGENKSQPVALGETDLLDSFCLGERRTTIIIGDRIMRYNPDRSLSVGIAVRGTIMLCLL